MARSSEERDSVRYPAIVNEAILAWRVDGESVQSIAEVANISQSGALVFSEQSPCLREPAWLRLEKPSRTDWIQSVVIGIRKVRRGFLLHRVCFIVRLRFKPTCPFEFFKVATHGKQLDATFLEAEPEEADRVIWR